MVSSNQRGSEVNSREEFEHSLQLLDEIASQHLRAGALTVLLLPAVVVLLPSLLGQLNLVRGLLGMMWVLSAFTLIPRAAPPSRAWRGSDRTNGRRREESHEGRPLLWIVDSRPANRPV